MTEISNAISYPLLATPQVQLSGPVNENMYGWFKQQLANAAGDDPLVVSITTLGGDPEMARAMADDIRLIREYTGRETLFLGKVAVYSAGATFMSGFPADKRWLTRGTRVMLHERQMTSTVHLSGPLNTLRYSLEAKLAEIEDSIRIQDEGFRALVAGSGGHVRAAQGQGVVGLVYRGDRGARPGAGTGCDLTAA